MFCFALFDSILITTSSIKLSIFIFPYLRQIFFFLKIKIEYMSKIKSMKKMISTEFQCVLLELLVFFKSNVNLIFRSIINNLIHRINWLNISNFCRIIIIRSIDTWLNPSFTSRNRHEKMFFEFFSVWILCNKHIDASIVNLFFLFLICSLCKKFECSTKCDKRVAMIFSDIFLKQLKSIIIRYDLDCE